MVSFRIYWSSFTRSVKTGQPVLCEGWCRLSAANEEAARQIYSSSFPGDRIVSVTPLI